MEKTVEVGSLGEDAAVTFLLARGYEILARNYRYRRAEIDILARQGQILAVVEVKTRTGGFYEALTDSISRPKIGRLVLAAHHFVREHCLDTEVRFDVIQIIRETAGLQIIHLEDAFYFF